MDRQDGMRAIMQPTSDNLVPYCRNILRYVMIVKNYGNATLHIYLRKFI